MNDYYATLGVQRTASAGEVRKAFRQLVLKYHPDRNKGSDEHVEIFTRVAEAYEVLGDPRKRQIYDRMNSRENGFAGFGFEGFGSDDSSDPVDERNRTAEQEQRLSAYILMNIAPTYARGVHALHTACVAENNLNHPKYICPDGSSIYRPLTFKEGIVARLREFNTLHNPDGSARSLDDRLVLFSRWNDSCTGIAKKAGTTKFKIIP
ncbi:J domain-containing protein, partial [Candidatus Woesearchaeota archaeon]|nr:J domain-containing protein [Candidatus Woesearchaeota archaeon]